MPQTGSPGVVPPLTPSDRGFVGDRGTSRRTEHVKRKRSKGAFLVAICLVSVVAVCALAPMRHGSSEISDSSTSPATSAPYQFKVYAMNATATARLDGGTALVFELSDLPFEFSSLCFGDFRTDTNLSHIYYAGSGLLVNASGQYATVTLKEDNGKAISSVDYRGQNEIVFNGEVKSMTYPQKTATYSGTDQMIQDWRNAAWSPADGIFLEHPDNVTVLSASFFVMTIESQAGTEIPEFSSTIIALATMLIIATVMIVRKRAAGEK